MLDDLTPDEPVTRERWKAALVPHAGLIYSGSLAADVLRRCEIPEQVIIVGPKHTRFGCDWAVAPNTQWEIPGATIQGHPELARKLCESIEGLQLDAAAHQGEHAIEVELPWLARFAPQSKVVGVAIGSGNLERCQAFAEGLANCIESKLDKTLLIISSDMNHFANETETRRVDQLAIEELKRRDPSALLSTVRENKISMCGVLPAVMILDALDRLGQLSEACEVGYETSARVSGDTSRVVGYCGMLFR